MQIHDKPFPVEKAIGRASGNGVDPVSSVKDNVLNTRVEVIRAAKIDDDPVPGTVPDDVPISENEVKVVPTASVVAFDCSLDRKDIGEPFIFLPPTNPKENLEVVKKV